MPSKKIMEMRNKAHETNAANKILDMINKLRKSNNDLSKRRWVWELIQNAKDVANSSGKISISVNFDELEHKVEFKHNGRLFTTENLVFLIEQVSSKDRDADEDVDKKIIGKFGTGFLTTHLLSGKVTVSGYLQDAGESPCKFRVELDRTGKDKQAIINAIEESCRQLDESSQAVTPEAIDENAFNTCFTYQLDSNAIETAKKGIENLIIAIPYVLAFAPTIDSIIINEGLHLFRRKGEPEIGLDSAYVLKIEETQDMMQNTRFICVSGSDGVAVAVEIGKGGNRKFVERYDETLPRLFCDFPLIGTEDFAFPVIINSPLFNPNEPRDGIWLNDNTNDDDNEVTENRNIIAHASECYKKLLSYLNKNEYEGIYNITHIINPVHREWLSCEWLNEEILNDLKDYIKLETIISTHKGNKTALVDEWNDSIVHLMNDTKKERRENVWNLLSCLASVNITKKQEIENWYNSLWEGCHTFGLDDLVDIVSKSYNLDGLCELLAPEIDVIRWLNQFYSLVFEKKSLFANLKANDVRLFPNQDGVFCELSNLYVSTDIDSVYKDLAKVVGVEVTSWLAHEGIEKEIGSYVKVYSLDNLASEMYERYESLEYGHEGICSRFICLRNGGHHLTEEHKDLCVFLEEIYPHSMIEYTEVSRHMPKLLKVSLKYWCEKLMRDISSCYNLSDFMCKFNVVDGIGFINDFISYLTKYKYSYRLDDNKIEILLNQNEEFVAKEILSTEVDDIDEVFKDVCGHMGDDIRRRLLHKDIFLVLPSERSLSIEGIADKITKFVEENARRQHRDESNLRIDFNRLYRWLRDSQNITNAKKYFGRLMKNIYWFYNEDEISSNMDKADKYSSLLSRLGVTNDKQLEELLLKAKQIDEIETEDATPIEVTEDLLAQHGISSDESLQRAIASGVFGANFIHISGKFDGYFAYVQEIIERSKINVIEHLQNHKDYDLSDIDEVAPTVFVIKKYGEEIYLIVRPSDREQVIIYYQSEFEILEHERDWELWIDNGISTPEKLTFGKILRLTGMNKIPLKKVF